MALPLHALLKLSPYLKNAQVLSLSYPDLLIPEKVLEQHFKIIPTMFTDKADYHKVPYKLPETRDVFKQLGATLHVTDVVAATGFEDIIDLNYEADIGQFDVVIDPGTVEHCFNVGQAFLNAAHAVKPGGIIYHISPMDMMNHGFYNFNPTLFHDFYTQNGWEIIELNVVSETPNHFSVSARFFSKYEHNIICIARRKGFQRMKFPVQAKYLKSFEKYEEEKRKVA
jgi:SAM-dependent methyltransferase